MIAKALEKYLKISPKKLAPVADLVRKKRVEDALHLLVNTNKKGAGILKSVIESAYNNAKRIPEKDFEENDLFIARIIVNGGPVLKRFRAMSMGRAGKIRKRTSHVLVELDAARKASLKAKPKRDGRKDVKKPAKVKV